MYNEYNKRLLSAVDWFEKSINRLGRPRYYSVEVYYRLV